MKQGHNIVSDGWAGASNPHPYPMPTAQWTNRKIDGRTKSLIELHFRKLKKGSSQPDIIPIRAANRRREKVVNAAQEMREEKRVRKKTSDAGHNMVADRWAGASSQPHPQPPSNTLTHTQYQQQRFLSQRFLLELYVSICV